MKTFVIDKHSTEIWDPDRELVGEQVPYYLHMDEAHCLKLSAVEQAPERWVLDLSDSSEGTTLRRSLALCERVWGLGGEVYALSLNPRDTADPLAVRQGWLVSPDRPYTWWLEAERRLTKVTRPDGDSYWTLKAREDDDTDDETLS